VIVDLAEVVPEVSHQMNQVLSGGNPDFAYDLGIVGLQIERLPGYALHRPAGRFDFSQDCGAGNVTGGEFRGTVTQVTGAPQLPAEVVLQISCKVQSEGSGRVGESRWKSPDVPLVGIRLELAPKSSQVPIENRGDGVD
jgi:hypothetical protein